MAKPTKEVKRFPISAEAKREQDLTEIEQALTEHKTAVLETIELLQRLHDRGILPLLNNLLAEGDQVMAIVMKELNKPQNSRVLENLVQLALMLGALDLDRMKPLVKGVNAGIEEAAAQTEGQTSLFRLWKSLRDPEIQRAMTVLTGFLKGMGSELAEDSK